MDRKYRAKYYEELQNHFAEEGYTEEQVLSSDTPFGFRGGFNCRHSWEVK